MVVVNDIFKGILKPLVGIFRGIFSGIFTADFANVNAYFVACVSNKIKIGQFSYFQIYRNNLI